MIAAALEIAERIRAAIAEISVPGTDVPVTVSIGVAGFPGHASTLDRLERLADAALYVAKRQGRNRVELAELTQPVSADGEAYVPAAHPEPSANDSGPVPVPRGGRTLPAEQLGPAPTPGSAWPTGPGRSAARAWSAGRSHRPSRPCRAARRSSAPPS